MSVFLPRKLFLLALASAKRVGELHALLYCLTPGTGVRCPPLSRVSWRRRRTPPLYLLGLRALLYRPYQTRAQIAVGGCYVLCGWSGVTWTVPHHIAHDVSRCSSSQDVARRRSQRTRSPSGSRRRYLGRTSFFEGVLTRTAPKSQGDPGYCSISFKKNFAVTQVLKAGTWQRHTTFTRHYLRDLDHRSLDTFHLGPVVSAQALV